MSWKEHAVPLRLDEDIIPFWEGLNRGEFLLYRCKRCGAHYWPMAQCRAHSDIPRLDEMEWTPASGKGTVFTFEVVHKVNNPAYADELPFALAMVELDEGPMFPTRIVGCSPAEVRVGLPVELALEHVPETGVTLPLFRPRQ